MKLVYLSYLLLLSVSIGTAQTGEIDSFVNIDQEENFQNVYKLYPTKNYWTFIKLNTRNGKMWQVHFSLKDEGMTGEIILNSIPLIEEENETNNRFALYPTKNMYNFLLLDQIDGFVYQVQWSMEKEYRFLVPIY